MCSLIGGASTFWSVRGFQYRHHDLRRLHEGHRRQNDRSHGDVCIRCHQSKSQTWLSEWQKAIEPRNIFSLSLFSLYIYAEFTVLQFSKNQCAPSQCKRLFGRRRLRSLRYGMARTSSSSEFFTSFFTTVITTRLRRMYSNLHICGRLPNWL